MRLPEDPEPSSNLGANILSIIRLRLLASQTKYAIIQFLLLSQRLSGKSTSSFFYFMKLDYV